MKVGDWELIETDDWKACVWVAVDGTKFGALSQLIDALNRLGYDSEPAKTHFKQAVDDL